jgi:predicted membrane channel-forming protein YqfA (hemolysin III family)
VKDLARKYIYRVDWKLAIRQAIFCVIIAALIVIIIFNTIQGKINLSLAISGFLLSNIVGFLLSRMFKIFWHQEKKRVIARLDVIGFILLAIYFSIEYFRKHIFEYWLSGEELNAFGLIILTGLLLGRFIGMTRKISDVLLETEYQIEPTERIRK